MTKPHVSCITVTYGPTPTLWAMLESLHRTTPRQDVEVIVVTQPDAESSMATEVARRYPNVSLIALNENVGFGAANNRGVEIARGELVALLNPDLVLPERWLDPLQSALTDESVTIAAPPLLNWFGYLDEAGQVMYSDGGSEPFGPSGFHASYEQLMFSRDVDYSSAACWLMRRNDFVDLDGFDLAYSPAYFEDVDLAFRVWKAGGRCRLVSSRPVIHDHAAATTERTRIAVRSRDVFRSKWTAELEKQPRRFIGRESCERVRDHRCTDHRRVDIDKKFSDAQARVLVDEVGRWAQANPTARATVHCNHRAVVEEWRRIWCGHGLEIVSNDK